MSIGVFQNSVSDLNPLPALPLHPAPTARAAPGRSAPARPGGADPDGCGPRRPPPSCRGTGRLDQRQAPDALGISGGESQRCSAARRVAHQAEAVAPGRVHITGLSSGGSRRPSPIAAESADDVTLVVIYIGRRERAVNGLFELHSIRDLTKQNRRAVLSLAEVAPERCIRRHFEPLAGRDGCDAGCPYGSHPPRARSRPMGGAGFGRGEPGSPRPRACRFAVPCAACYNHPQEHSLLEDRRAASVIVGTRLRRTVCPCALRLR